MKFSMSVVTGFLIGVALTRTAYGDMESALYLTLVAIMVINIRQILSE